MTSLSQGDMSWTKFEIDILTFAIERGYTARDISPSLPGRSLTEIGEAIAQTISPKAEEPWRVKYVHSTAEDQDSIAGTDREYRAAMKRASDEYDMRWRMAEGRVAA